MVNLYSIFMEKLSEKKADSYVSRGYWRELMLHVMMQIQIYVWHESELTSN